MQMMKILVIMSPLLLHVINAYVIPDGPNDTHRRCPRHIPNISANICIDPIHSELDIDETWNGGEPMEESAIHDLLSISRTFNYTLTSELAQFEMINLQCDNVKRSLQHLGVSDLIQVQFCTPHTIQNQYTRIYADVAETTQLLRLMNTLGAETCCMSIEHLHLTMRNQVLSHWFAIYRSLGYRLSGNRCHINVSSITNNSLRCEDIRAFVYVTLRHALRTLDTSIRFLEQTLH